MPEETKIIQNSDENFKSIKFIADIMVGKLARYLRMAGIDVLYNNNFNDEEILSIAEKDNRIIITRDTLMLERKEIKNKLIKAIYIQDDNILKQLYQIKKELKLDLKPNLIRCLDCNTLLMHINKENTINKVPEYVYKTQKLFCFCPKCNKYYWRGTHFKNIKNIFSKINLIKY